MNGKLWTYFIYFHEDLCSIVLRDGDVIVGVWCSFRKFEVMQNENLQT
jgi:hypothetical protein